MIAALIAAALATSAPAYPDLATAIDAYASTEDASTLPLKTLTVCSIAYRHTVRDDSTDAADMVAAYAGPNADRLKLSCVAYFNRMSIFPPR